MQHTERISLYDEAEETLVEILLSKEDAERAQIDIAFATALLNAAKLEKQSETPTGAHGDGEGEEEDMKENGSLYRWTHPCVLLLLQCYQEMEAKFSSGKMSHKKCWEEVASKCKQMGHDITATQCSSKLRSLKKTYKSVKDHNKKSGNDRKTWPYFEVMDEIFSGKAWSNPIAVASSSGLSVQRETASGSQLPTDAEKSSSSNSVGQPMTPTRLLAKRLHQKEQHEQAKKQRHDKRMAMDRQFLEVLTKLAEK